MVSLYVIAKRKMFKKILQKTVTWILVPGPFLSDSNGIETHNHVVGERTVNRLAKLASHFNFRYGACFEQKVPWHSGRLRCGFTLKLLRDMIITYSQGLFFVFKESSKSLENEIFEASNYILYQLLKFIQIRV